MLKENPEGLSGTWLMVSKDASHTALLTPQDAKTLLNKLGESTPTKGTVRILNGNGKTTCLAGEALTLTEKEPACILALDVS